MPEMIKQKFRRDTIKTTQWKNGGGQTREIACSGPNEGYWRLSIADVGEDGPFSQFEGLSRVLTVTHGAGLRLEMANTIHQVLPSEPFAFSGEVDTYGRLIDGPIQDFNLIFDETAWFASVRIDRPENLTLLADKIPALTVVYCLKRNIDCGIDCSLTETEGLLCSDFQETIAGPEGARALRLDLWAKP